MKIEECISNCVTFLFFCMSDGGMSPLSTIKLFCDCFNGERTTYYFCTLALFSH